MKTGGFFKSNWSYIIWFCFYFTISFLIVNLFTATIGGALLFTGVMYAVTLLFSLSPIGEAIIRMQTGAERVRTNEDSSYLIPLFDEVYRNAIEATPNISRNIRLYIINDYDVNAFAVGRNTIAVTRGAVEGFSEDNLKGVLAHEFGHIAYGDTKALLLTRVGNGFFCLALGIVNIFIKIFDHFISRKKDNELVLLVARMLIGTCNFVIWVFLGIGSLIICSNSRYSEFLADGYADRLGFGRELIGALYLIRRISSEQRTKLKDRLMASHPFTDDRIERLEGLE